MEDSRPAGADRRQALHGVLIDRMFRAMIARHLQHARDLDAGEFVP